MSSSLSAGTVIDRYEILSLLGVGGMGEVYLAHDSKLQRKIALKVLPVALQADPDRLRRFRQEATAAASLNHPNIAHIYEIGEENGRHFIAMEYVDGITLREKLRKEPVELSKILRQLQHVAEGLAKAHDAGIVHRDLKPDNIMISSDGLPKILDFGLAKLNRLVDSTSLSGPRFSDEFAETILQDQSAPGLILGTMGYMSPEQAQGKTDKIDRRSDIFSFGCILFEAITGHKPFAGSDAVDSLNKIIREPAPPISSLNPAAPSDLQRIVRRCLAKDPDERYQTIKDVAIELKEVRRELESSGGSEATVVTQSSSEAKTLWKDEATRTPGGTTVAPASPDTKTSSAEYIVSEIKQHKTRFFLIAAALLAVVALATIAYRSFLHAGNTEVAVESIAVVPLVNETGNQNAEWVSDGLTESIINSLTQLPNLKVIARSTVFRYKGKQTDPIAIGKELGVRAVLTGRISKGADDSLIISAELIDIRDNKQLWGDQFERKMADMLSVQRDIAREITTNLRPTLTGEQQSLAMKQHTQNPEAYSLYLKGRFYWNKRTPDDFEKAIAFFRQAIDKDPNYALAYSGLADSYALIAGYGSAPASESMPQAKAAAQKALALDDTLAEAHASMGQIYAYDYEWESAEREYKRAIQLNPNYASARQWYAEHLSARGQHAEAIAEILRALDLDPLSLIINRVYADLLVAARRFDEAIEQYRKTIELDPSFATIHFFFGRAYVGKGMYREAVEEFKKASATMAGLDEVFVKAGWKAYLQASVERMEKMSQHGYVPPFLLASFYGLLGDRDHTIQQLEKAYAGRDFRLTLLKVSFEFDSVRDDPRFIDLTKRVGIP